MDPTVYFSIFFGALVFFAIASIAYRPAMRPCPACGADTPLQNRRCRHCEYLFGRV
jgi:ribosomal protein L40E